MLLISCSGSATGKAKAAVGSVPEPRKDCQGRLVSNEVWVVVVAYQIKGLTTVLERFDGSFYHGKLV